MPRRRRADSRLLSIGEPPIDLSSTPDNEIIDYWNDTDADSDQEKLPPRQPQRVQTKD